MPKAKNKQTNINAINNANFIEKFIKKRWQLVGMVLGLVLCYLTGTVWLKFATDITFQQALLTGVVPFVIFDFIKIAAALFVGPVFRRHLRKANVI